MYPYKGVSLTQLFQNMAADEDTEETLVADSTSDPNSDWGTQDEQDCALFAESQRLIGSTLHDADAIEVQRSNETKHKSHILVPELNSMVHKAKVIKQLAQNKRCLLVASFASNMPKSHKKASLTMGLMSMVAVILDYGMMLRLKVRCDVMMKDPTALPKYFGCAVSHQQGEEQNMSSQSTSSVTV